MTPERNYLRIFVIFLILIFPILCNMTEHAGSIIMVLLTLTGLPICFSKTRRPKLSDQEKWIMWAFVSYFAVYLLSLGLNYVLGNLADPRMKHIDHEQRMLYFIPIFFLLRRIRLPQWTLWYSVVSAAIFFGIFALVEKFIIQSGGRISGGYHSIAFGDLAIVIAFISLAGLPFFRKMHPAGIFIPIIALLLGLSAALLSGTRGAWITIPALMIAAALHLRKHFKMQIFAGIAISILLLSTAAYFIPQTGISERFQKLTTDLTGYYHGESSYSSSAARIEGWRAAWIIFTEHPIFGAGPGNFQPIVLKKIDQGTVSEIIAIHSQPHSAYFSSMADCGTLGLMALLSIFIVPGWMMISLIKQGRADRNICYAGLMLIIGFMQFGLTETIFGRNVFVGSYIVMSAIISAIAFGYGDPADHDVQSESTSQ